MERRPEGRLPARLAQSSGSGTAWAVKLKPARLRSGGGHRSASIARRPRIPSCRFPESLWLCCEQRVPPILCQTLRRLWPQGPAPAPSLSALAPIAHHRLGEASIWSGSIKGLGALLLLRSGRPASHPLIRFRRHHAMRMSWPGLPGGAKRRTCRQVQDVRLRSLPQVKACSRPDAT